MNPTRRAFLSLGAIGIPLGLAGTALARKAAPTQAATHRSSQQRPHCTLCWADRIPPYEKRGFVLDFDLVPGQPGTSRSLEVLFRDDEDGQ